MANIASQKKRILRSERERTENRLLTSTVKTYFRRLQSARGGWRGERDRGRAPPRFVSKIDKAVQKGALPPKHRRAQEGPGQPSIASSSAE